MAHGKNFNPQKKTIIAQREVVEKLTYIKGELQKILRTMQAD